MGEEERAPYVEMSKRDKAEKIAVWEAEHGSAEDGASCTTLTLASDWHHCPVASAETQEAWGAQKNTPLLLEEATAVRALATMGNETDYGDSSDEEDEEELD